jgi:hypothetical protein
MKAHRIKPGLFAFVIPLVVSLTTSCDKSAGSSSSGAGSAAAAKAKSGSGGKGASAGGSGGDAIARAGTTATTSGVTAGSGGTNAGRNVGSAGATGAAANGGAPTAGASGSAATAGANLSDELFAEDRLPRFDITLPPESITALNKDPGIYARGSLKYADITLADVGVRLKGEASLRTLDKKAAFKLKLDEFVGKQTLLGMKRITLNNMVSDPTFMAERLAYHLFRFAKLPAPRCNSALVYVNDEFYGVYANVESEDKTFLSRWFTNNDGNLYEDAQVDFNPGNAQYFDLQTNETLNDRTDLTALIDALAAAGDETYLKDLDATLDTAHFLRYSALEGAVNQWDGYSYTYFEPNNFRIYHDPTTGKFTFLPWGMDLSFKPYPIPTDDPNYTKYMRELIPMFQVPLYENGAGGRDSGGKIFVECLRRASCKQKYVDALREIITLYDEAQLPALAAGYYEQIKGHVEADTRKEVSYQDFEDAYKKLLEHLGKRTAAIRADLTAAGF